MAEDEEYRSLFFTECDELLGELQDHLTQMSLGNGGKAIVDAAFRAVHSVKGGAAAFGMDQLAGFAHEFETVMDACRAGRLAADARTLPVLTRASDMMLELVEHSRTDGEAPLRDAMIAQTQAALRGLIVEDDAKADDGEPASPQPFAGPAPVQPSIPAADADGQVTIRFTPLEDFLAAGHDPLRMLRAAGEIGLASVRVEGTLPPLDALDPMVCPWSWTMVFAVEDPAILRDFFSIYDLSARIEGIPATARAHAAPSPAAPSGAPARPAAAFTKSLRVPLDRIDRLVNLVGEIVITQAAVAQDLTLGDRGAETGLSHSVDALSRQVREMQDSVMAIRAQPIKSVFSRMPRIVRDLCDTLGREVRIDVSGEETEVDTSVIEELVEPLTHMIRNAMDHGIESPEDRVAAGKPRQGLLRLAAHHRGERVVISLEDDGRGIDRDRVAAVAVERGLIASTDGMTPDEVDSLIFLPGFSTARQVSNVSGRGVGMDVVRRKIQALGGRCLIRSTPGQGTRFQVTLPLTLAVLEGMIVEIAGERYVLPLSGVIEALQLRDSNVERLHTGQQIVARRGEYLPLFELQALFAGAGPPADHRPPLAIVVDTESNGHVGLFVDALIGQRQVVLKGLEATFRPIPGVSGATILGDGRVALILDIAALVERQRRASPAALAPRQESA